MDYIAKEAGSIRSLKNRYVKDLSNKYCEEELKRLVNFLYVVEEYELIIPILDKFRKQIKDKRHFNEVRASIDMINNNKNNAEHILLKNVRLTDRSDDAYYRLARFYVDFNDDSKLAETVKEIGMQHPDRAITYLVIAMFYTYVGRFDDANIYYEKTIAKAPEYGDAYATYALSRLYQGNEDEAIILFEKSVKVEKKSFDGVIFLNRYYVANKEFEKSITLLENRIEIFDDYPFYLQFLIGHSYMMLRNFDMAYKSYQQVYNMMFDNKQEKLAMKLAYKHVAKK